MSIIEEASQANLLQRAAICKGDMHTNTRTHRAAAREQASDVIQSSVFSSARRLWKCSRNVSKKPGENTNTASSVTNDSTGSFPLLTLAAQRKIIFHLLITQFHKYVTESSIINRRKMLHSATLLVHRYTLKRLINATKAHQRLTGWKCCYLREFEEYYSKSSDFACVCLRGGCTSNISFNLRLTLFILGFPWQQSNGDAAEIHGYMRFFWGGSGFWQGSCWAGWV